MYGHHSQYTADNDAAETDMYTQKCQVAAASTIREMRSSLESTSHYHLQRSLDWTWWANGFASQVTVPHINGLIHMGPC